jgi:hypothetical protein
MIEISHEQYWKRLKYHDAILYCAMIEIDGHNDWRLPTKAEVKLISKFDKPHVIWYYDLNRLQLWENSRFKCVPVRDI